MKTSHQSSVTLRTVQAIFFLPILLAFVAGSLPVLVPLTLYRWLTKNRPDNLHTQTDFVPSNISI